MQEAAAEQLPPYEAPAWLSDGRAQTLATLAPRPGLAAFARRARRRRFRVADGVEVVGMWHPQPDPRAAPTLLLQHGLTGSADSGYMIGTAAKAFARGFNVLRLNARNCGAGAHLSRTIYHAALYRDVAKVIASLRHENGLERFHLAGFSLGASLGLRLAGDPSEPLPPGLVSLAAVSAPLDLAATAARMEEGTFNRLVMRRFLAGLREVARERERRMGPEADAAADREAAAAAMTLRAFDAAYTAPLAGYPDVDAYYRDASTVHRLNDLRLPTLIVHAADDPIIPAEPYRSLAGRAGGNLALRLTARGGHVAFRGRARARGPFGRDPDRAWAESRVVDFCQAIERAMD